ncbi:MAG: ABC transporter ATP-binding protein [Desulfobacterales bacterium]
MADPANRRPIRQEDAKAEPILSVRDLWKGFSDRSGVRIEILRGVGFDLGRGETLSVQGASGIGKSTLLHILGALDYPDSGTVQFDGRDIFGMGKDALARFRNASIGFVFQFHHLLPEFSALENVMMPLLIRGDARPTAASAAEDILLRVGLKDRLGHRVTDLSGGEQQRVAIGRAIVAKPSVLLADEPTGNLDRKTSDQVHRLLMKLNTEFGMSMVIVTHNPELAAMTLRKATITDGILLERN